MTVEEYRRALCLLEKECPECKGEGHVFLRKYMDMGTEWKEEHTRCPTCTKEPGMALFTTIGKVLLLEGVREKCQIPHIWVEKHPKECECQGRGWVPTTNPFKYAVAAGRGVGYTEEKERICWSIFDGELAFYSAFAKALGVEPTSKVTNHPPRDFLENKSGIYD